jgi:hypothetical protein
MHITKIWFDGDEVVMDHIPVSEIYKQEPVAWVEAWLDGKVQTHEENCFSADPAWLNDPIPLYTAPPKREWVGLTREEALDIESATTHPLEFARAIEAKLKDKNT